MLRMKNKIFLVAGLGYGDEGKGKIVDAITRKFNSTLTIKYNGCAQCAHNVVTDDGKHHTFSQFGAGTLAGADTFISEYCVINPISFLNESTYLEKLGIENPFEKVYIDENAIITTPFHMALNRLKEMLRGDKKHGSCGEGIWEAVCDKENVPELSLTIGDLFLDINSLYCKLNAIWALKKYQFQRFSNDFNLKNYSDSQIHDEAYNQYFQELSIINDPGSIFAPYTVVSEYKKFAQKINLIKNHNNDDGKDLRNLFKKHKNIVFEGSQGVLLDKDIESEHQTATKTTFTNAYDILEYSGIYDNDYEIKTIGVTRTYQTRHGAGPFVTENGINLEKEKHNVTNQWQNNFKTGALDLVALDYSIGNILECHIDYLAITHLDCLDKNENKVCFQYGNEDFEYEFSLDSKNIIPQYEIWPKKDFCKNLANSLQSKIFLTSSGPSYRDTEFLIEK